MRGDQNTWREQTPACAGGAAGRWQELGPTTGCFGVQAQMFKSQIVFYRTKEP